MPAGSSRSTRSAWPPGSQSALRLQNQQLIIESLIGSGPQTQAELARRTGLSTATVSNIVRTLTDQGLATTSPTTSSGRRALQVSLDAQGAVAVGIDFGRRHVRVVLATLGYRVLQEESVPLPMGHRAEEGLETAANLLDNLLDKAKVARSALLGAGVGIPGPIDRRTGTVIDGAILPEWVGLSLPDALGQALEMPVFVDNDANLGALAQVTWGPHTGVDNLVFIKIGSGIGTGLIINGSLYYGNVGITGEIGHSTITDHGLICRCGNRGCLETVASTSVMIELLSRGLSRPVRTDDIVQLALDGHHAALRVIDDAGAAIGRALAGVANLINPEVIVVGGPLSPLGNLLLEPVRRGLLRHTVPLVGQTTALAMSSLGDRAEALGAAALVLQKAGFGNN